MKNKVIGLGLSFLLMATMLLASCATSTTTSTSISTTSTTKTTSTPKNTITTNTTVITTTIPTTTTATGNWWDSLGTPQYGGQLTIRTNQDVTVFDPFFNAFQITIQSAWMERLFTDNWIVSPSTYKYQVQFRGSDYTAGQLAQSWEFTDPSTFVVHLRQNVYWQNIPPANGREFVASDVVAHYTRWYNPANGSYLAGGPHATSSYLASLASITAADKYSVTFTWKTSNPEFIYECLMISGDSEACIENPEAVAQWGNVNDWHHAMGTGPFILQDFVSGSSATLVKNRSYWGTDQHYPQNKLPYIDKLNVLIMSDNATALAALRTGKIDALDGTSIQNAQDVKKTNPEIVHISVPLAYGRSIQPRIDVAPYNNIKVREALQMAINLPDIAANYYLGSALPYPIATTSFYMTGWGFPYTQWPQDLQDQYAYNPTAAKQLLADAGYANGFNTDIVVDTGYDMSLLEIIKSDFAAINVNMEIRTMPYSAWSTFVSTGHKEDALAASSTGSPIGRTTEPLTQMATLATGQAVNYQNISDPVYDAFYPKAQAATTLDGVKQVLKDLNQYVAQQHYCIALLQPTTYSLVQPWLKGYNGQNNALSGPYGPSLLFFYPARFWIDQNMKKSMGH